MGNVGTYLDSPRTRDVQNAFVNFINRYSGSLGYFPDPYVKQTGRPRPTLSPLAWASENMKLVPTFPKVEVGVLEVAPGQMTQKKSSLTQERLYEVRVYYHNQKSHKYNYSGSDYIDAQQNSLYLELIEDAIMEHNDELCVQVHNITPGTISEPILRSELNIYSGVLPFTVKVVKKYGGYTRT